MNYNPKIALQALDDLAKEVRSHEERLADKRAARNKLALDIIATGKISIRKVAKAAGVSNPYLVKLKNRNGRD